MRNILAICRREVFSFFVSPTAYFVIAGYVLLGAYFFFNLLGYFNIILQRYSAMSFQFGGTPPSLNDVVVSNFFNTSVLILVFLVPLLTMRIIAEEKKGGTFELLATSPLSMTDVVLGKFLAVGAILALMTGLIFLMPMLLVVFCEPGPEVQPILSGYLALLLNGLAFASIGMAISSFTDSQVVAGVTSLVTLLILYIIHSPAQSLGEEMPWLRSTLEYLSPVMQSMDMLRGVITSGSLLYYASLIVFGLFLSQRSLLSQRA